MLGSRCLYALALVCAAGAAGLAGCSSGPPPPPPAAAGETFSAPLPAGIRDATFTTSDGHHVTLRSLTGKVVVISDMMTLCQESCPLDTANVVAAARAAERAGLGNRVEFLSITIDPDRDTTGQLAAYRNLYAPAPANWTLLTGSDATVAALWKALGVYVEKVPDTPPAPKSWLTGAPLTYDLTHSDEVFFLDRHGVDRFVLDGVPHLAPGAPLPGRLASFMDATGRANVSHPQPGAWTLKQELQAVSWLAGRKIAAS